MKILAIHADFVEYEAKKKAFKAAQEGVEKGQRQRIEECLVIYTAVETCDETAISTSLDWYLEQVRKIASQVNATKLVLYPYAHLSSTLAKPAIAQGFLEQAQEQLLGEFDEVQRAPFGWYKSFTVSCKGHPLSELSRSFTPQEAAAKGNSATATLARAYKDESFEFNTQELDVQTKRNLSAAYAVAVTLTQQFPGAQIGSVGLYQQQAYLDILGVSLKQKELKKLVRSVKDVLSKGYSFEKVGLDQVSASLQIDIASDLGSEATAYSFADQVFVPLFKDPFVHSVAGITELEITNLSSAYWKNNEKNKQLTRLTLVAFSNAAELDAYHQKIEDAKKRSHVVIGKEQGLFVVSKLIGSGLPLLAPKGMIIRSEVTTFLWELHKHKGYSRVSIPHIAKTDLYKTSGHWDKFGDELFHVKGKSEEFVLKPMNCPHHIQIFDNFSYSYRDLPVRFFEPTTVYRDEKPGQLLGLSRVRAITQDDGHLFCRVAQIKEEVRSIVEIILSFYRTLGMDKGYWVSLSVRGDDMSKYLGGNEVWDIAESSLEEVATSNNLPFKKIKGEAAFYGPKLDFMFKDALGREWQLATVQLDFNLPERFDLSYTNEAGEKERPVMIHRAISGSLERFMSVLIEHFAGKFPVWLSPEQVRIVTVTDRSVEFAKAVEEKLRAHDIRVTVDSRNESIGKKVREAQLAHVNYVLTIGDKEVEAQTLAVRDRSGANKFGVAVDDFVAKVVSERDSRSL